MKITVKNVTKKFGNVVVLEDLNLSFESGNIYGLVGRNGSGKSVFLKMICGFYNPSTGEILYDGINIIKTRTFPPSTRCLIEKPNFFPDLTGYENLEVLANIQKLIGKKEIEETLKRLSLFDERNKKFYKYSLGMKQKLGIAQVLMEDPQIMILDEPFNGVEKETAGNIRKILLEEKEKGKIIIIASHIKEDIDTLANVVYEFDAGKVTKI